MPVAFWLLPQSIASMRQLDFQKNTNGDKECLWSQLDTMLRTSDLRNLTVHDIQSSETDEIKEQISVTMKIQAILLPVFWIRQPGNLCINGSPLQERAPMTISSLEERIPTNPLLTHITDIS